MPKRFSERILDFMRAPGYRPMKAPRLARAMGIAEEEHGDFREAVDALRRVGRVVLGGGNAVMLPHPAGQVVGTFRANPRGFGFVVPDEPTAHGDFYVAPGAALDAVTGDRVLCRVIQRGKRDGKMAFAARILEVVERGDNQYVGRLSREGGVWFVQPDGNTLHVPILIADPKAKSARAGDQVVVEIVRYPSEGKPAKGVIVERLGPHGRPGVDLLSVIRQYHLPDCFSDEALAEARAALDSFDADEIRAQRQDLSDLTIITIDPDDARDYDDAISLESLKAGGAPPGKAKKAGKKRGGKNVGEAVWELGVHIADVSAFVPAGGTLDADALERGTSVYFPGHVLPMLPEVLSNGLCSLQEGEPRLCKSAFIRYDRRGNVVGTRFANTLIRSAKRLTYRQATAILEGRKGRFRKPIVDLVQRMDALARAIRGRRLDDGMIVLDLPSVDLVLDDNGRVVDARPEDTSFSHTIIEMFMVEANEAVGRLMERLGVPFLRRIHDEPDEAALTAMGRFLRAAGYPVPAHLAAKDLQGIVESLRGRPDAHAVSLAVLKSMQMAEYAPRQVGHFALASKCYAHFTSPIRRYPDLMLHRLLDLHLTRRLKGARRGGTHAGVRSSDAKPNRRFAPHQAGDMPDEQALQDLGRRLSCTSRRAESAERELKTLKVLQLLSRHVGDTFKGVVTGVTSFGMFVQHPKYLIDGLLRFEDLGGDWWDVDVQTGRVVGERTRRTFALGTSVKVQISDVDIAARQLKLSLADVPSATKARVRTTRSTRSRKKTGKGRRKKRK